MTTFAEENNSSPLILSFKCHIIYIVPFTTKIHSLVERCNGRVGKKIEHHSPPLQTIFGGRGAIVSYSFHPPSDHLKEWGMLYLLPQKGLEMAFMTKKGVDW